MPIQELLFELLRIAIGSQEYLLYTPTADEWKELFHLAEKHALVGVCFAGLQRLDTPEQRPPQKLLYQCIGIGQQIQERNKTINRQCLTLQRRLQKDGFCWCLLKGQGNAMMYGRIDPQLALLRQPGDIDIWVEGGFESIMRYVQSISPTDEVNEQHVHLGVFHDTEVEVHFTPSKLANRWRDSKLQKWFAKEADRQMNHSVAFEDGEVSIPTVDFNLVYQMLHVYRHLFSEGIGLRQLMDYYVLMTTNALTYEDCDYVRQQVSHFGMKRFAAALMWVLGHVFSLEETMMPWKPDERGGRFLLDEVMQMGNFGHSDQRFRLNSNDSHLHRYWLMVKSKWRFIRYFPNETLWQPIDTFIRFFELRKLRFEARKASSAKY